LFLLSDKARAPEGKKKPACWRDFVKSVRSAANLRAWAEHAHYCASNAGVVGVIMLKRRVGKGVCTIHSREFGFAPGVIPFGETR